MVQSWWGTLLVAVALNAPFAFAAGAPVARPIAPEEQRVPHQRVPGDPEQGRRIFEQRCAVCHGPEGRGDGPNAPFLSPRPASLISAGTSVKTDEELLAIIANGKPRTAMTGWKDILSDQEQRDVLAFIRALVRFQRPLTPPLPPTQK